jgi:hypothetical protein
MALHGSEQGIGRCFFSGGSDMAKSVKWIGLLLVMMIALGCTPQTSDKAEDMPQSVRDVLVDQLASDNLVVESAVIAPSPEALRETDQMWCVVTSVTPEGGSAIYSHVLAFSAGNNWNVTLADADDFDAVGCRNFRAE